MTASPIYTGSVGGTFIGGVFTPFSNNSYSAVKTMLTLNGTEYPGHIVISSPVGVTPAYPSFPTYEGFFLYEGTEYPLLASTSTPTANHPIPTNSYYLLEPGGGQTLPPLASFAINTTAMAFNPVAACFVKGTWIAAPGGGTPVEDLAIGDTVVTASGEHHRIRWIGRRSYAGRFLAANPDVQPILFRAGSLGEGLPRRDLRVSPEHAMFLHGLLVPAGLLVNGTTIIRDRTCNQVEYLHVELDAHDVLLAEGAPSESYVDDGNRGMFHNAAECEEREPVPAVYCAPRVESGYELEAIRAKLAGVASQVALAA